MALMHFTNALKFFLFEMSNLFTEFGFIIDILSKTIKGLLKLVN